MLFLCLTSRQLEPERPQLPSMATAHMERVAYMHGGI